jgi:hypothetical protein
MRLRNKIWAAHPDPEHERGVEHIFDHLCRHIVCVSFRYAILDERGRRTDKEHFITYSGFVMCVEGVWFILTAGHILKEELDQNLANKRIEIVSCNIADYFGKDAKVRYPTPFNYEDMPRAYIDDEALGLDIGLIFLRPFFQEGLKANGIVPITEENWLTQHRANFESFMLLGFPKEIVDRHTKPVGPGEPMDGMVGAVLISIEQITARSQLPPSVEIPESVHHWFVGRLKPDEVPNIKGMSGGPIFGLRQTPDGGLLYWVVAAQSRWYEKSRIILGCPVPIFAEIIRTAITEHYSVERTESDSAK